MKQVGVLGYLSIDRWLTIPSAFVGLASLPIESFNTLFGGKGGNQALALAKLGYPVILLGKLGADAEGKDYLNHLYQMPIETSPVTIVAHAHSGQNFFIHSADNTAHTLTLEGANALLDESYILAHQGIIRQLDYLLVQLDIPACALRAALNCAFSTKLSIILDPSCTRRVPEDLMAYIHTITPTLQQVEVLTGQTITDHATAGQAAATLLNQGVRQVVIKDNNLGSYLFNRAESWFVPAFPSVTGNRVACHDIFNAALVYALATDETPLAAVQFAGASVAMPPMENEVMPTSPLQVMALLRQENAPKPVRLKLT